MPTLGPLELVAVAAADGRGAIEELTACAFGG
jgi:hypothetical protein